MLPIFVILDMTNNKRMEVIEAKSLLAATRKMCKLGYDQRFYTILQCGKV